MELVMQEQQPKTTSLENPNQSSAFLEFSHEKQLIEFVWNKIQERHRNTTQAFRYFDSKGKGKLKKADLILGLEKLRVRLAAKDIDTIWQVLDGQKRGFANFNDFCVLQETRVF